MHAWIAYYESGSLDLNLETIILGLFATLEGAQRGCEEDYAARPWRGSDAKPTPDAETWIRYEGDDPPAPNAWHWQVTWGELAEALEYVVELWPIQE